MKGSVKFQLNEQDFWIFKHYFFYYSEYNSRSAKKYDEVYIANIEEKDSKLKMSV